MQKIFTQLVGAVAYIHSHSCVHRDLKLENVLLDKHENVKLCDFGFTREYEGTANYLQTFCGTICYSAPEMLRGEKYAGEKVDVWSLGIILYALLKGELPFDEDDDFATKSKILKDEPDYPDNFPETAKALLKKLLSKRALMRPGLASILTDPFLADYAPQQQAILKLSQPAPFTTELEKSTLERMRSTGVDIDKVIENVLSQRCDALAGWWALLIEKERRKEGRRESKRKEREADLKMLRRLSGASSRIDKNVPTLVEVDEGKARPGSQDRPRSSSRGSSRGRKGRRSTPQILVSDLPQLPEGAAVGSPDDESKSPIPPPPIDKDSSQSRSNSRPPLPPKEKQQRRTSQLHIVTTHEFPAPVNGTSKLRLTKRSNNNFLRQLTAIKHWIVESTKRARSPGNSPPQNRFTTDNIEKSDVKTNGFASAPHLTLSHHERDISGASGATSLGAALTPAISNVSSTRPTNRHRNSMSPSPITPRSATRHSSGGLRGRKSTSSSLSSVRSMPHYPTHSKASSTSSHSTDALHSPGSRSAARSPHSSIKVMPVTPTTPAIPPNSRLVRTTTPYTHISSTDPETTRYLDPNPSPPVIPFINTGPGSSGLMFARRKRSAFKGPQLTSSSLFGNSIGVAPLNVGSPALFDRHRIGSGERLNLGLRDPNRRGSGGARRGKDRRKSQIIEEEEEEEEPDEDGDQEREDGDTVPGIDENAIEVEEDEEEDDVEEVEAFSTITVDESRGETVHSVTVWEEAVVKQYQETSLQQQQPGHKREKSKGEQLPIPVLSEEQKPATLLSAEGTVG